jgi:hypothetical protein
MQASTGNIPYSMGGSFDSGGYDNSGYGAGEMGSGDFSITAPAAQQSFTSISTAPSSTGDMGDLWNSPMASVPTGLPFNSSGAPDGGANALDSILGGTDNGIGVGTEIGSSSGGNIGGTLGAISGISIPSQEASSVANDVTMGSSYASNDATGSGGLSQQQLDNISNLVSNAGAGTTIGYTGLGGGWSGTPGDFGFANAPTGMFANPTGTMGLQVGLSGNPGMNMGPGDSVTKWDVEHENSGNEYVYGYALGNPQGLPLSQLQAEWAAAGSPHVGGIRGWGPRTI